MFKKLFLLIGLLSACLSLTFAAQMDSPVGRWITISDKTHDRSGIADVFSRDGKLAGKIMQVFPGSGRDPNELCVKCPGDFKNKRVAGLVFLWGLVPQTDGTWGDGSILDPHDGNIYRATLKLTEGGKQLELRGHWGPFWRTQTWIRAK